MACQGISGDARRPYAERVKRIFDDRLVAGLDRLRTVKQRRDATGRPQPADIPDPAAEIP